MVPVALYDTLKLIQQNLRNPLTFGGLGLESQPALPPAHENLVIQALELFQQHLQEKHGKSFGLSVDLSSEFCRRFRWCFKMQPQPSSVQIGSTVTC